MHVNVFGNRKWVSLTQFGVQYIGCYTIPFMDQNKIKTHKNKRMCKAIIVVLSKDQLDNTMQYKLLSWKGLVNLFFTNASFCYRKSLILSNIIVYLLVNCAIAVNEERFDVVQIQKKYSQSHRFLQQAQNVHQVR